MLNTLARTHAVGVGPVPGYTKELHRVKLAKGLYAVDTPAVPSKEEAPGPHTALPLSPNRIVDDVEEFIQHFDMDNLLAVLGLPAVETFQDFMDGLGGRVGKQLKGGEYNKVAGARKLFKDWNEGRLLYFTETPDLDEDAEAQGADGGPIAQFFLAANKKTVAALKKDGKMQPESKYLRVEGSLFDAGEDEDEDGEDGEDEEMDDGEDDEDMEDGEDEDEEMAEDDEEEEEELPPPPPSKKQKAAAAKSAPAPASTKKAAAPAAAAAPSNKKAATPQKKATPAPAPAQQTKSKKRSARDEDEEEEEDAAPSKPAAKKQATAPKANSSKPTPTPAAASASKKKGKK